MTKITKTNAQLAAEIEAALATPRLGKDLRAFSESVKRVGSARQKRLHQALLKHPAIVVTDSTGRKTLLLQSGEMSNPSEGAHRVTMFWTDGPSGHITRKSIMRLAQDLSRDLSPVKIEPATDAEVMAWMDTAEYHEGSKRVLEMQRRNQR
jgi:hypothetical protein